jgi:hypothetical protein
MWHLGAGANLRVLDLDKGAGLGALSDPGVGPQVGEGADGGLVRNLTADQIGVNDRRAPADRGVDQGGHRPDRAAGSDGGGAAQRGAREDRCVRLDLHVRVDPGGARVVDRDPRPHVGDHDPPARLIARPSEIGAVVHPEVHARIGRAVGGDAQPPLAEQGEHVAEVILALGVVVGDPGEGVGERLGVECVGARVDLPDRELLRGRVAGCLGLDDPLDVALRAPDNPPIGARIVHLSRHHGRGGAGIAVRGDQLADDPGGDQRVIAGEDEDGVGVAHHVAGRPQGAAGAIGFGLDDRLNAVGEGGGEVAIGRDDHADPGGARLPGGGDRPGDHRPSADLVQDLRHGRAHAGALACGHDHGRGSRGIHSGIVDAGACTHARA